MERKRWEDMACQVHVFSVFGRVGVYGLCA